MTGLLRGGWLRVVVGATLVAGIFALLAVYGFRQARVQAQFSPAAGTGPGLPETVEAIDVARVTTRILYIDAHPDDESAAVLTYLARGLHADVALLSLTRGEGGQNDLGPEQNPQLGLIRTQELLAATRGYGVHLFFTRAHDFGFSKTPEETEKIWGDQVLEDMVRVIRTFKPNVVINGWGNVHFGHGHHQASGLLTPKAVAAAADSKMFPELERDGLKPWSAGTVGVPILDLDRGSESPQGYSVPIGDISPLYGKSYREIGLDGFANHRTQGISAFLGSPFLRRPVGLVPEKGFEFSKGMLDMSLSALAGTDTGLGCGGTAGYCDAIKRADDTLSNARTSALKLDWKEASAQVAKAGTDIDGVLAQAGSTNELFRDQLGFVKRHINRALELTAGFEQTADADRSYVVASEAFKVNVRRRCRPEIACDFQEPTLVLPDDSNQAGKADAKTGDAEFSVTLSEKQSERKGFQGNFPEPSPLIEASQVVTIDGYKIDALQSVTHVEATSTRVDRVPLRMVPAYTLMVEPNQTVEVLGKNAKPFDVLLRVHSYATQAHKISAGVDVPQGWSVSKPAELAFEGATDKYAKVTVTPPQKLTAGKRNLVAYAKLGDEKFSTSLEPLPTLPTQLWSEPAQCVVHAFDINVPANLRVGYITAENEPVPEAMERLGIHVEMLEPTALAFGDLSRFNAIVVGLRAYELRHDLPGANQRLLDYVSNGGTLVVQYERDFAWDRAQYAPYPAKIAPPAGSPLPRVTDETSPVKFLKPDDPLLNTPNKITQEDFKGWVQERGLYFWTQFASKYTPLLAMNDPGEPDQNGSLVYTNFGKGVYIYTGIAFFRQLPEGVAGAYRLFVNLISATQHH
ncbi:MAG: PIG-L family deacetylase [Acidobacteria bacterium]|nr:PIG-L family deacetylase [Acidobacteriota bacterium]